MSVIDNESNKSEIKQEQRVSILSLFSKKLPADADQAKEVFKRPLPVQKKARKEEKQEKEEEATEDREVNPSHVPCAASLQESYEIASLQAQRKRLELKSEQQDKDDHKARGTGAPVLRNQVARGRMRRELTEDKALQNMFSRRGLSTSERINFLIRRLDEENELAHPQHEAVYGTTSDPFENAFVRRCFTTSVNHSFPPHLNPHIEQVRARQHPCRRAHIQSLLRTPRRSEPRCSAADHCIGQQLLCDGGGETLMAFWYEHEWIKAHQKTPANPQFPATDRRCFLCLLYDAVRLVCNLRADNEACGRPDYVAVPFYNLFDVPGEFCLSDSMGNGVSVYECLPYNILRLDLSMVRRVEEQECVRFELTYAQPGVDGVRYPF